MFKLNKTRVLSAAIGIIGTAILGGAPVFAQTIPAPIQVIRNQNVTFPEPITSPCIPDDLVTLTGSDISINKTGSWTKYIATLRGTSQAGRSAFLIEQITTPGKYDEKFIVSASIAHWTGEVSSDGTLLPGTFTCSGRVI